MVFNVYPNGVRRVAPHVSARPKVGEKIRGKVLSFSFHSRLRLREFLLTRYIPGCAIYGVTLTIPRQDDISNAVDLFSVAVHRLRVYFLRRFPSSGYVWRVELQRSRMPHLHLVVYSPSGYDIQSRFLRLWSDIVLSLFSVPSLSDFLSYGVRVVMLDGNIRAFRYICDHAGKHKQAQLGFKGRQWGVVGRSFFVSRDCVSYDLSEAFVYRFSRFLRRLSAFSVPYAIHGCPFGTKLVKCRNNRALTYASSVSVLRWLEYYDLPF